MAEGKVVQPPLEIPDSQPVGQRRINLQRFLGDALPLLPGQGAQRLHVVQAVCQLDQDHPYVLGHGHQHLAQALGIDGGRIRRPKNVPLGKRLFRIPSGLVTVGGRHIRGEVHSGQLGNPVHQRGDLPSETGLDLAEGHPAVLDHIVEQGGHDGGSIQAQISQGIRCRQWMSDVGLAGLPELSPVALLGEHVSDADLVDEVFGKVLGNPFYQGLNVGGCYPIFVPSYTGVGFSGDCFR